MPQHPHATELLYAAAVADAMGAATEGDSSAEAQRKFPTSCENYRSGSPFGFQPGEYTDDTQTTVAAVMGWQRPRPGFPAWHGVLDHLRMWMDASPPDIGLQTARSLQNSRFGLGEWERNPGSAGNGALMRSGAEVMLGFSGEELIMRSVQSAALTHADPRCLYANALFVQVLTSPHDLERAVHEAGERCNKLKLTEVLIASGQLKHTDLAWGMLDARAQNALDQVRAAAGAGARGETGKPGGYVLDTLQNALAHARLALERGSYQAGLDASVQAGGDADTIACVTGLLMGSRGMQAPEHLKAGLRSGATFLNIRRGDPASQTFSALLG